MGNNIMKGQNISESDGNSTSSSSTPSSTSSALLENSHLSLINAADRAEKVAKVKEVNLESALKEAQTARQVAEYTRIRAGRLERMQISDCTRLRRVITIERQERAAKRKEKKAENAKKDASSARELANKLREQVRQFADKSGKK